MRIIVKIKIIHFHLESFFCLISVSAHRVFASASRTAPVAKANRFENVAAYNNSNSLQCATAANDGGDRSTTGLSSGAVRLASQTLGLQIQKQDKRKTQGENE